MQLLLKRCEHDIAMSRPSPRVSHFGDIPYHKLEVADKSETMKDTKTPVSPRQKENSYYMENYDATITVHKSPPQNRKHYFDYIEIDDETKDIPERSFHSSYKLAKRKNLRVTFSDHIEVDFIADVGEGTFLSEDEVDGGEGVGEKLFEIPLDKGKALKQISSSAEFKRVSENISPTGSNKSGVNNSNISSVRQPFSKAVPKPTKCQHQIQAAQNTKQPLLQKRRDTGITVTSLSDLEKKTKHFVEQIHDRNKKAEVQARVAKALFPDISSKIKAQPSYKQFIANAKRAVEITRRYERPWVSGNNSTQSTFSVCKKRSESVKRTASLPRNFKLPDDLAKRPSSEKVLLNGRLRIKNS